jgi:hypothetical protein
MSNVKLSLIISIIYIVLGTIFGLAFWSGYNNVENKSIYDILWIIIFPSSFIMISIIFTTENPILWIIFTQLILFFIYWAIILGLIKIFRNPKIDNNNDTDIKDGWHD